MQVCWYGGKHYNLENKDDLSNVTSITFVKKKHSLVHSTPAANRIPMKRYYKYGYQSFHCPMEKESWKYLLKHYNLTSIFLVLVLNG